MTYNFDKLTRRDTNCFKWDIDDKDDHIIPLWVADMDFEADPKIVDALHKRVDHAIFGYTKVPASFYDAILRGIPDAIIGKSKTIGFSTQRASSLPFLPSSRPSPRQALWCPCADSSLQPLFLLNK